MMIQTEMNQRKVILIRDIIFKIWYVMLLMKSYITAGGNNSYNAKKDVIIHL